MEQATPKESKRPTWIIAVIITLGVVAFFAAIYGLLAVVVFNGLKQTGQYLNGAPITISDETIEARVKKDTEWILTSDYEKFDSGITLSETELSYHDDIDQLQKSGSCVRTNSDITKGQGGFDGGAVLRYKAAVDCSGAKVYDMEVSYTSTALSKTDASDIHRFRLSDVVVATDNETLIRNYMKRTKATINVSRSNTYKGDGRTVVTYRYATLDEYRSAVDSDDFKGCKNLSPLEYRIEFRRPQGGKAQAVRSSLSTTLLRCE